MSSSEFAGVAANGAPASTGGSRRGNARPPKPRRAPSATRSSDPVEPSVVGVPETDGQRQRSVSFAAAPTGGEGASGSATSAEVEPREADVEDLISLSLPGPPAGSATGSTEHSPTSHMLPQASEDTAPLLPATYATAPAPVQPRERTASLPALFHGRKRAGSNYEKIADDEAGTIAQVQQLQEQLKHTQEELTEARLSRDTYKRACLEAGGPRASHPQGTRSFAVAARSFSPAEALMGAPGDGALLSVAEGETLEVLSRHLAGWVRVRKAIGFTGTSNGSRESKVAAGDSQTSSHEEGWIPDGVLQAVGEIGRGIASRTLAPEEDELELAVPKGTLLKLLAREGEWWLVEADGCRGFVPFDAVREPMPGEESGIPSLGLRLRRGMTRLLNQLDGSQAGASDLENNNGIGRPGDGEKDKTDKGIFSKLALDVEAAKGSNMVSAEPPPWAFGLWAYQASYYAIAVSITMGVVGILWYVRDGQYYPAGGLREYMASWRHIGVSVFSLAWGVGWLVFNTKSKLASSSGTLPRGTPLRGSIFLLMSMPLLSSGITVLAGVATAFVGVLSFVSALRHEVGAKPETRRKSPARWIRDEMDEELQGVPRCSYTYCKMWWDLQGFRGERPKWFIILLWLAANGSLCALKYYNTRVMLLDPPPELVDAITKRCWTGENIISAKSDCSSLLDAYRLWVPIAKLCGQGLNLNCSLLILPICQHFLKKLNTASIQRRGFWGQVAKRIPTHKNLIFHKGLAASIALYSLVHTLAHYMAYSFTLTTFIRYGQSGIAITLSVWTTGAILVICICIIYSVSRDYIKRTYFEAFIHTHIITATVFMLCLLWHGPVFYLWAVFPLALYLVDRYFRSEVVGLTSAKLLKVRWRPPVLQLVFDAPWNYNPGEYIWLCCPKIAKYEKHPFTIASAPETGTLAVAIKCWHGGWTEKLRDFLAVLCTTTKGRIEDGAFVFEDIDWISGQLRCGISTLPEDGTPLLQIDGPHPAPAMRFSEFKVIILAAAGIGLTPSASILRSLLQHRWRSQARVKTHSIYFAWLCPCSAVPAYEWFADELSDSEVALGALEAMPGEDQSKRNCELHLFVTQAPPSNDPKAKGPPAPRPAKIYGMEAGPDAETECPTSVDRPYTGAELLDWMQHPATKSNCVRDVMALPRGQRPNEAGHTYAWNGRADWEALFEHVAAQHAGERTTVGVFFCGAPTIGKDLKILSTSCKYSNKEVRFRLLKEAF